MLVSVGYRIWPEMVFVGPISPDHDRQKHHHRVIPDRAKIRNQPTLPPPELLLDEIWRREGVELAGGLRLLHLLLETLDLVRESVSVGIAFAGFRDVNK